MQYKDWSLNVKHNWFRFQNVTHTHRDPVAEIIRWKVIKTYAVFFVCEKKHSLRLCTNICGSCNRHFASIVSSTKYIFEIARFCASVHRLHNAFGATKSEMFPWTLDNVNQNGVISGSLHDASITFASLTGSTNGSQRENHHLTLIGVTQHTSLSKFE